MTKHDLQCLFDWCDAGKRTNAEFWRRFLVGSTAYDTKTKMDMFRLAEICNSDGDDKEQSE